MCANATGAPPGWCRAHWLGSAAIVVLILLAGCSGFGSSSPAGETDRQPYTVEDRLPPNLTAENETELPPSSDYLAPGLSTDGIEDVSLLVEHHFSLLERESGYDTYVFVRRSNTTVNETVVRQRHTRYVVDYPDRWYESHSRSTNNGTATTIYETWVNESEALNRITRPNESVKYVSGSPTGPSGHPPYLVQRITDTLSAPNRADVNVTIEEIARNETTWYSLTWEHDDGPIVRTMTVHLRGDGLITQSYGNTAIERGSGETEVTRFHFQFTPDANVTLEQPEWYGDARNATNDEGLPG